MITWEEIKNCGWCKQVLIMDSGQHLEKLLKDRDDWKEKAEALREGWINSLTKPKGIKVELINEDRKESARQVDTEMERIRTKEKTQA